MSCGTNTGWIQIFRIPSWLAPTWTKYWATHDEQYARQYPKYLADVQLLASLQLDTMHSPSWQKPIKKLGIEIVRWALSTQLSQSTYNKAGINQKTSNNLNTKKISQ